MIKWSGTTTDGLKRYTAQGQSYEELYNAINDKYGYTTVIDTDIDDEDKTEWRELDYKHAIEQSRSQCYYQTFENE